MRMLSKLLTIPESATDPASRGFTVDDPAVADRLERIGRTFLTGYHAALNLARPRDLDGLAEELQALPAGWRGFGFEGAGMALALLDFLTVTPAPGRGGDLRRFIEGSAWGHRYLVHVGAGWSLARTPRRISRFVRGLDPTYRWLAVDGYGFHRGYFGWRRSILRQKVPVRLRGYARRVFDQGLGRSLWFVCGASPVRIAQAVAGYVPTRRGDLWSGVGLACAYAGGVPSSTVERLVSLAGIHAPDAAQGAAFAARARQAADDPSEATEAACGTLCGMGLDEAAALTARAEERIGPGPDDGAAPAYERWRRRTRELLMPEGAAA